jgi:hypothetical protein
MAGDGEIATVLEGVGSVPCVLSAVGVCVAGMGVGESEKLVVDAGAVNDAV